MPAYAFRLLSILVLLPLFTSPLQAQTLDHIGEWPRPAPSILRTIRVHCTVMKALAMPIETKRFFEPMKLRDALDLLAEESERRGPGLTLDVNEKAFKNAGKRLDLNAVVWLPDSGPLPASVVLQRLLDQALPNSATYSIQRDIVEITTTSDAEKDGWIRLLQCTMPVCRERLLQR